MAITKIVLDRQSDLILSGATITNPTGITASDISFFNPGFNLTTTNVELALDELNNDISTEVSNRISDVNAEESRAQSAELVLTNDLSSEVSNRIADVNAEESRAQSAEASLATAISDINAADFGKTTIASGLITGTNKDFGLTNQIKTGSELVYLNGQLLTVTDDYTVVGNNSQVIGTVSFVNAPQLGDKLTFAGQIIA